MGIRLHPKLGLNARLTTCTRCGGKGQDILLLGDQNRIYECEDCGQHLIGAATDCPTHPHGRTRMVRELGEHERIQAGLCRSCEEEVKEHREVVKAGGIFWECKDCRCQGVIRHTNSLAGLVRGHLNTPAPKPCGIYFTARDCPACGPNKVAQ